MLTEVLNHVISFVLTVNYYIKSYLLLKSYTLSYLLLIEVCILLLADKSLSELLTILSYVLSLREGTDCSSREQRKSQLCLLDLFSLMELRKSCIVLILYSCNSLLNSLILTVYTAEEEFLVLFKLIQCRYI